jgi:hypothetical protein
MRHLLKQLTRTCFLAALVISCADDRHADYEKFFLAFGTVERPGAEELFIVLDDNDTTLLVSESVVPLEFFKDKMRLFVDYSIVEKESPARDFHYRVRVNHATEIPTTEVLLTPTDEDTGNDPITVENYWLARGFLTFRYRVRGTPSSLHAVNLLLLHHSLDGNEEGINEVPVHLELRHDAGNDPGSELLTGHVSFPLYKAFPEAVDPLKLRISYNDMEKGNEKTTVEITYYPVKQP